MTKIKLCGLMLPKDINCANELNPDFVGFVFDKKSKRYLEKERAKKLKDILKPEIKAVGVFVDEDPEYVEELLKEGIIDIVQLHGSEDEDYVEKLRNKAGCKIIKAFKISREEDVKQVNESKADYVLLDSGMGTGKVFDWNLLKNVNRPYFLAGGLNEENVSEALEVLHPFGVDVSSGIETDGKKDLSKMKSFVNTVRKING